MLPYITFLLSILLASSRVHEIEIDSDRRDVIPLANFGLTKDGFIKVNVTSLNIEDGLDSTVGLIVECSLTKTTSEYVENKINVCQPDVITFYDKHPKLLNLELRLEEKDSSLHIDNMHSKGAKNWDFSNVTFTDLLTRAEDKEVKNDLTVFYNDSTYSFSFEIKVAASDEGQYSFFFYRCLKSAHSYWSPRQYTFNAQIVAKNGNSFLSAGEIPLIFLYTASGLLYFVMVWVWVKVMVHYSDNLFKIHYLMGALVFAKFLACILHAVDYYFISTHGKPDEAWAILWYIIHLVRGILLFISLALIGMGFAFIKHVLSYNEKLVLMTVVPLQILANVAYIIIDSSEEADLNYGTWKKILIFVDLLCCGAIIFPVMWSIRHLQQATERSDNKTTLVLSQLKLFRHFYILVVVYIYITRIALRFMEVVLSFEYTWCTNMMEELATISFFLITGWNFRPYISNPYYKLVREEEEVEMESMLVDSETLRNRNRDLDEEEGTLA